MNEFKDIAELTQYFTSGQLAELPATITVGDTKYTYSEEYHIELHETIETSNKPKFALIYESEDGINYAIFGWNMDNKLQAIPSSVQVVERPLHEIDNRDVARSYEEKTVGTSLDIILMGLNDKIGRAHV